MTVGQGSIRLAQPLFSFQFSVALRLTSVQIHMRFLSQGTQEIRPLGQFHLAIRLRRSGGKWVEGRHPSLA